jgi:hypothetical protein
VRKSEKEVMSSMREKERERERQSEKDRQAQSERQTDRQRETSLLLILVDLIPAD